MITLKSFGISSWTLLEMVWVAIAQATKDILAKLPGAMLLVACWQMSSLYDGFLTLNLETLQICFVLKVINLSVHRCLWYYNLKRTIYPLGGGSAAGCSCIVSSPSLLKATPAAVNISPTWKKKFKKCVRVALGVPRLVDGFGWAACVIKTSMETLGWKSDHSASIKCYEIRVQPCILRMGDHPRILGMGTQHLPFCQGWSPRLDTNLVMNQY